MPVLRVLRETLRVRPTAGRANGVVGPLLVTFDTAGDASLFAAFAKHSGAGPRRTCRGRESRTVVGMLNRRDAKALIFW